MNTRMINRISLILMLLSVFTFLVAPASAQAAGADQERAIALIKAGKFKEALPLLDAVIALDSNNASAYLQRGIARIELRQWDPALADYEVALRLDPTSAEAHYRRGYWWATDAKDRKAVADYDRAIQLDPGNARYLYARATAYDRLRDWRRAADAYRQVLSADSSHADAARGLDGALEHLGQSATTSTAGISSVPVPAPSTVPTTAAPTPASTDPSPSTIPTSAGSEPAAVLTRVLGAQARGDLSALEREWDLDAVGPDAARLQRARLRAVAASLRLDEFKLRVRATLFSADGNLATVRAEVSFRASNAGGSARLANGVLGMLRRTDPRAPWMVIGVVPDELLNNELVEREDQRQAALQMQIHQPARRVLANASNTPAITTTGPGLLASSLLAISLAASPQAGTNGTAQPITYKQLNRNLDDAMSHEFGVTKLKFVMNSMNTSIGQVPGAGDLASWFYQVGDTGMNSIEVLGETMKHGFTSIGALKATQVFAGVVQIISEVVPPADVASDIFQYRLEAITANAEIRRTIYHIKQDLERGRLKTSGARLRLAEGRVYPPGVRVNVENTAEALLDPSNPASMRVSYEGGLTGVVITTPELLAIQDPRLPFEVVAQLVIDPGLVRYEAFDERAAKFVGGVQRGSKWVLPILIGVQVTSDTSTGSPILADFKRMRMTLGAGIHPDSMATWGWQPCRGTQRLSVGFADLSSSLPVTVRNPFLDRLSALAVVDGRGQRLERITLGPGESLADLKLVGIDPTGSNVNLSRLLFRPLPCADLTTADSTVVTTKTSLKAFSITAAGPGSTRLAVRISGDQASPDLKLNLPIVVTGATGGWRLVEVSRSDSETPTMQNHRQKASYSDTGLTVTCGASVTLPDFDKPQAQWPRVGYDAEVRVNWGAMPNTLAVGQTVKVNASVSRRFEPTPGWLGDTPAASVRISARNTPDVQGEVGRDASASFVVPATRKGDTLGIGFIAWGCGTQSSRTFIYKPADE